MRLLIEANTKQSEAPLAEAESLLSTLAEAWMACTPAGPEQEFPWTISAEATIPAKHAFAGRTTSRDRALAGLSPRWRIPIP